MGRWHGMAAGAEFFLIGASRSEAFGWFQWHIFGLVSRCGSHGSGILCPGVGVGGGGGVLRPAVFTDFGLQLAWGRPEGHRGWGGAFTLTGFASINRFCSRLGPIPETRGWGSRCRLGHELFPAPGWAVGCGALGGAACVWVRGGGGARGRGRGGSLGAGGCAFAWSVRFV